MTTTTSPITLRLPENLQKSDLFQDDPIVVFEINDVLDIDLYRTLEASYPQAGSAIYDVHKVGNKQYVDNRHPEFWKLLEHAPEWRRLYDTFESSDVLEQLYRLTAPFLTHRAPQDQLPWRLSTPAVRGTGLAGSVGRRLREVGWVRRLVRWARRRRGTAGAPAEPRSTPVYLGFEFSTLTDGSRIPPHTDVASKLLSLMIYFPQSDDQAVRPLGTEFYRAKPGQPGAVEWQSQMPDDDDTAAFFEDHETYFQLSYTGNALVGFVKTDRSWHGLQRIELPPGEERRALVINIFRS